MKVLWSGIAMVDGSGKINGSVAARNRYGSYVRTKATPVNPNTTAQQLRRGIFGNLASAWRTLTEAQREAWDRLASLRSVSTGFGRKGFNTGMATFIGFNATLDSIGLPPTLVDAPSLQGAAVLSDLAGTVSEATMSLTVDVSEETSLQIWATPNLSPGINFAKPHFRQIDFAQDYDGTAPLNPFNAFVAKYGAPLAGSKVFFQLVPVNSTTGEKGTPIESAFIVE